MAAGWCIWVHFAFTCFFGDLLSFFFHRLGGLLLFSVAFHISVKYPFPPVFWEESQELTVLGFLFSFFTPIDSGERAW